MTGPLGYGGAVAEPVDVFVEDRGLWCTADPGSGEPSPKAIPTRTGWRAAEAWAVPIDANLPQVVADLFESTATTSRGEALLGLVEAALNVVGAAAVVPTYDGKQPRWLIAPDPGMAADIRHVCAQAEAAGLFLSGALISDAADRFLADLVNALIAEAPPALTRETGGVAALGRTSRRTQGGERPAGAPSGST